MKKRCSQAPRNALATAADEVLEYYHLLTQNPIRDSDVRARQQLLGYDLNAIKAGILLSICRSKNPVKSLKYCLGATEEAAQRPMADGERYVRYLEGKVKRLRSSLQTESAGGRGNTAVLGNVPPAAPPRPIAGMLQPRKTGDMA